MRSATAAQVCFNKFIYISIGRGCVAHFWKCGSLHGHRPMSRAILRKMLSFCISILELLNRTNAITHRARMQHRAIDWNARVYSRIWFDQLAQTTQNNRIFIIHADGMYAFAASSLVSTISILGMESLLGIRTIGLWIAAFWLSSIFLYSMFIYCVLVCRLPCCILFAADRCSRFSTSSVCLNALGNVRGVFFSYFLLDCKILMKYAQQVIAASAFHFYVTRVFQ